MPIKCDLILAGHPEQQLFESIPLYVLSDHVHVPEHRVYLVERAHGRVGDDVDDEGAHEFVVIYALHLLDANQLRLLTPVHVLQVTRLDDVVRVQKAVFRLQTVDGSVNEVEVRV